MSTVDTDVVHALFAAQREAYEDALRLGRQSRSEHEIQFHELARAAIKDAEGKRDAALRQLEEARFLIARLLDHAGGSVRLENFVWSFGLCPKPAIVTLPIQYGSCGTLVALRTDTGEPWPPKEPAVDADA